MQRDTETDTQTQTHRDICRKAGNKTERERVEEQNACLKMSQ